MNASNISTTKIEDHYGIVYCAGKKHLNSYLQACVINLCILRIAENYIRLKGILL